MTELFPSFIERIILDCHAPNDYLTLPPLTSDVDTNQYESPFNLLENSDSVIITAINEQNFLDSPDMFDSHSNDSIGPITANSTLNTTNDQTDYDHTILTHPCKQQNRLAKRRKRSSLKINLMLGKVEIKENDIIFKKSSSHQSYNFSQFMINYFKILIKNARCSDRSKVTLSKHLKTMFKDCINDEEFQVWLVEAIELTTILSDTLPEYQVSTARQEKLTKEVRQIVYDIWKVNSVVSVHRSNNRRLVKIAKENILTQTVDLTDDDIMPAESKKTEKVQANRRISSIPYRILH